MIHSTAFGSIIEEEKSNRHCKLHLQTWIYIHCALSILIGMLGIAIGVLLLVYPSWHEFLLLYRQTLTVSLGALIMCSLLVFGKRRRDMNTGTNAKNGAKQEVELFTGASLRLPWVDVLASHKFAHR
ncbi:hypothetical protein Y032_0042g534 [Ancylostoma ceylanicum]|uniref:Uncharacterized protein n=1 Tax=Ancylostoma ceylanicum TaxID=53326 RepID=A0A016UFV3_9BILA|nr:hypothetical protein Y032_0042g534 [Ancylostoma ceylanicum]